MNHSTAKHTFARRYGRGFWRRKFSTPDKPTHASVLAAGATAGPGVGLDSVVGTDRLADARGSDESTKGTVARCVWSTDAPHVAMPSGLETAGAYAEQHQQMGSNEVTNQQRPSPPSTYSADGGVCCVMICQIHADRWATLAVIAIFICAFAVAAYRANRSSRPTTPPRGQSGVSKLTNNRR